MGSVLFWNIVGDPLRPGTGFLTAAFYRVLRAVVRRLPSSLGSPLDFEVKSRLGRFLQRGATFDPGPVDYLNLGSAHKVVADFLNVDFFGMPSIDHAVDLRFPLPFPSSCFDGIFTEHVFEHLTYTHGRNLLAECSRVLRPGGVIRFVVPDLEICTRAYTEGDTEFFDEWERVFFRESADPSRRERRLRTPLQALSFVTQEYGHVSCWDLDTARVFLEEAGFEDVIRCSFAQGRIQELLIDNPHRSRTLVSIYVEARVPAAKRQ